MIIVVMGASGCGKSTVGRALADNLGWDYQEGDELHPADNVAKMRAGMPLDDTDRAPWLESISGWMSAQQQDGRTGVVTCSSLKRTYRDRLRQTDAAVHFVYLHVSRAELTRRMCERRHFMPVILLDSQLAMLEMPGVEEAAITVDATQALTGLVANICRRLPESTQGLRE